MASLNDISKEVRLEKQKRNRRIALIIGGVFLVIAVIAIALYIAEAIRTKTYTSYDVISKYERADSNTVRYRYYMGDLLKFSRDGASGIDDEGNALWNGSYDLQEPLVDVCDRYVAIADMEGKEVYVYNGSDAGTSFAVPYPIADIKIGNQGIVAVVLEDEKSNLIQLYNPYGQKDTLLAEIPTNVMEDGYPVDIALSPDGQSVIVSYLSIVGGSEQSNVCFYNFSEVGQDKNRLVGGSPYKDSFVTKLEFCGDDSVCVFMNNGYAIYTNMKQPVLVHEEFFDEKIVSVFNSDTYIGFVFNVAGENSTKSLRLYNMKGEKVLEKEVLYEYDNISMHGEDIIFYNETNCGIMRTDGSEKFKYSFDKGIDYFIKGDGTNTYYLIDSDNISVVKLTEE